MSDRPIELTLAEQAPSNYECRVCGYLYEPTKGDSKAEIAPGTAFTALPENWRCPVCSARSNQFVNVGASNAPSGFQENLYSYDLLESSVAEQGALLTKT